MWLSTCQVEAFVQIDQQYYAALKGCTGESAGTTALAALVWEGILYVANAGAAVGICFSSGRRLATNLCEQQQRDINSSSTKA
jgi:hypothetical protein